MDKSINKLKKLLLKNMDKRVLVLSTIGIGLNEIQNKINMGKLYDKVLDDLLIEKFGYIDIHYIPDVEQEKIEQAIKVEKGVPLFSNKIIDCDLIIFLYVNPEMLKVLCSKNDSSYSSSINLQNRFIKVLKNKHYIKINLYNGNLNNIGRNVYICDTDDYGLIDKKKLDNDDFNFRFPYIKRVDDIETLKRKQGFLLIINERYLKEDNYIDIDKKYRHLFNHFNLVYIVTSDLNKINKFHIKYTNMYFIDDNYFDIDELIYLYYDYILSRKSVEFSKKKLEFLKEMNKYFKNKSKIKTEKLCSAFSISKRNAERYMNDYNCVYKNIGYDYNKDEWYIIH